MARQSIDDAVPTASRQDSKPPACATNSRNEFRAPLRGFTLIEIMVVVAIIGIIMAAGIPSLYGFFHKSGFRKSMSDIMETCQSARAKAIMSGVEAHLIIHPREGTMEVEGGAPSGGYGSWAHSAKIEGAKLYALKINNSHEDMSQLDHVRVKFYADGKCEEMTLLLMTDKSEMRGVMLEITTSLPRLLNDADIRALVR